MKEIIFNNPNKGLIERKVKAESEARMAQQEAEMELLMAIFAEEEIVVPQEDDVIVEETMTQEDIEFELMMIDDFRGFVLDICEDEVEWINNNIDLSHMIGTKENTVQELSKLLNLSVTKVRRFVRAALGYKRGSEYQNNQRQYVDEVIEDFRHNLYDDLKRQLKKAQLYDFYRALLDYVRTRVSVEPLGKNEDELTFFVSYADLRVVCKEFGVTKGVGDKQLLKKLNKLCKLTLLRNLEDEYIDDDALETACSIAHKQSKSLGIKNLEVNRKNYYVLHDLSPEIQDEAVARIKLEIECGLRSKDTNTTTIALLYGEEVQKEVFAQGEHNIDETKLRNFHKAAQILLKKQGYFTEEELRKQFIQVDKHTKKAESYELVKTYLSVTVLTVKCIKTRVNSRVKDKYKLPKKTKSNSFIYVPK